MSNLRLDAFSKADAEKIWRLAYSTQEPEWSKSNAPYFEEYQAYASLDDFINSNDWSFLQGEQRRCIRVDNEPLGMVSRYWVDRKTRWMEVGIAIYDEHKWGFGYGSQALALWTSACFEEYPELEHLGLSTWSGNSRMLALAESIGYQKEAEIRAVRFWQGVYYDSIKYGVLRGEWEKLGYLKQEAK
ncbi:MAG: GNAT family protein [Eubacteriales bacterium]|nr:GNAT family protein [Eubacteriales bacterium]